MKATANDTFHGMKIISDYDQNSAKGHDVVELTSAGTLVCRYYDNEGNAEDNPFEIDVNFNPNSKECNITGNIKRQVGMHSLLISESAVDYIQAIVSA